MAGTLPPTLSDLLRADAAGREQAWSIFVEEYSERLLAVARSLGGDADAAMDRYLFVLERLRDDDFARLRAYSPDAGARFTTWLSIVARRLCIDHHRAKYGRTAESTGNPGAVTRRRLVDLIAAEIDPSALPSRGERNALERIEKEEVLRALDTELRACASGDRMLLVLRFEEELTAKEIARFMGFPSVFHVYRQVNKLLAQLRRRLERRGFREP